MEDYYFGFQSSKQKVKELLKEDDIEGAVFQIFDFIESNRLYFEDNLPESISIRVTATLARLKSAFNLGLIEWDKVNKIRSNLIDECLSILEILEKDIIEGRYERRSKQNMEGLPQLFRIASLLEKVESLLAPYTKPFK